MSETSTPPAAAYVRQVASVDTLKALADPLRIAILAALTRDVQDLRDLPVRSVKELAAELAEPQTKLYRHVRQLEAAGLIRVASTRVVSGIVEQRYQASQARLAFGPEIFRDPGHAGEGTAMVNAFLNRYVERFAARQASSDPGADAGAGDGDVMQLTSTSVSPATARLIRGKLQEIAEALRQQVAEGEETVPVEVVLGFFRAEPPG